MRLSQWFAGRPRKPHEEPSLDDGATAESWPVYPEPRGFFTYCRWPDPGATLSLEGAAFTFVVNVQSAADLFETAYRALVISHGPPSFAPRLVEWDAVLASDIQAIPDRYGPDGRFVLKVTIAGKTLEFYADAQVRRHLLEDLQKFGS